MNDPELIALVTQAGSAGLIGWLWVTERRAGADREKRLAEAHDRLIQERTSVDQLVRCIEANTRALTALEVLCRSQPPAAADPVRIPGTARPQRAPRVRTRNADTTPTATETADTPP